MGEMGNVLLKARTFLESNEIAALAISVLVTTLVFAYDSSVPANTLGALPLAFAAVVTAFLLHEMAHRFVARKLRCHAVYKLWIPGLLFALLMMLMGVKIIAIGAVVISTYSFGRWGMKSKKATMREIGLISASGPAVNLAFALLFKFLAGFTLDGALGYIASINLWIALFNLIPIKPLDGSNVFYWNTTIWIVMVAFAILLFIPSGILSQLMPIV